MRRLSKMILWIGFPAVIVLFSYLFSVTYRDSQISRSTWFNFEPDETYEISGSQYFIQDRSEMDYYTNVANFLKETETSENSLGVKLSWDRRGSHFANITPSEAREVSGRIYKAGLWVWGGNYTHELALIFSRKDGFAYGVTIGRLDFTGWRHLETGVPQVISTSSRYSDGEDTFSFQSFRLYTNPRERVNDIYVFMDKFDIDEEVVYQRYDGYEIARLIKDNKKKETTPAE